MKNSADGSRPFWKTVFRLQSQGQRRCCAFGVSFIVANLFFLTIYQQQKFARLPNLGNINITKDKSINFKTVSTFPWSTVCISNLSAAVKGAPHSLPCGLTVNAIGRLGNLMGEYATLYALSEINNKPAVLLREMADVLSLYFKISIPAITPEEEAFWESRWKIVKLKDWMEPRLTNLTAPFSILYGYPCSWTFYHHLRDRILQEFRFHDHILQRTYEMLNYYRRGRHSVTFIGVHNRRSDYVSLMANQYRGVVADAEFFRQAFHYFESKYRDAVFLVVSDDIKWCRKNMNNSKGNVYFVGNNDKNVPIYDLALMANCNHSIITIGTFGYWGAYLAGGDTVYLTNYTLSNSPFLKVLKYDKFYLPHWKPIAANLSAFKERKQS